MTPRLSDSVPLRLTAQALAVLGAAAMLAFTVQFAAADQATVSIDKTSDAVEPVAPGESFAYTITVDVGALPATGVTDLVIDDGTFDFPQIAINSADYAIDGGPDVPCTFDEANATCTVGDLDPLQQVVATIDVTVDSDVQVACTNPETPGVEDDTVRNTATVSWEDADGGAVPWEASNPIYTVDLDCTGWTPPLPVPDTTINTGPAEGSSTTSTSASFTFSGTNTPTSFECKLDAGAFAACTSPKAYSGLAAGSHTFSVRGVNASGPDATPATRTWTITGTTPPPPFTDISGHPFENDIKWLYNEGITGGCTATRYCPNDNVSRDQMATFLDRVLPLPGTTTDFFDDDDGSIHENAINRLAAAGITGGCATRQYCPKEPVMRDQMASFLSRAYALPGTTTDFFTDDETNIHEGPINRLADSEITGGCGPTTYCPRVAVTRGQMAAFLHRADPLLD